MYSDPVFGGAALAPHSPHADDVRTAMDYTRGYAERMDLINMTPQGSLSPIGNNDGYVLAEVGEEYLVYRPVQGDFTVNLAANRYTVEWFNPANGDNVCTKRIESRAVTRSYSILLFRNIRTQCFISKRPIDANSLF